MEDPQELRKPSAAGPATAQFRERRVALGPVSGQTEVGHRYTGPGHKSKPRAHCLFGVM